MPSMIDVLLGADVYSDLLQPGLRKRPPGSPVAQQIAVGWVLFGLLYLSLTQP